MIMSSDASEMNNRRLDQLIRAMSDEVEGREGFWEFVAFGKRLICVTDESHDRMRIMTTVAEESEVSSERLQECMRANFDRALDARYCISSETLWAVFIHPLNSLDASLFRSGCSQVAELSRNFGSSYSSGVLRFGA